MTLAHPKKNYRRGKNGGPGRELNIKASSSAEYQRIRRKRLADDPGDKLSPAEIDVMELLIKGYTVNEAADRLGKVGATVRAQLHMIKLKLRARTNPQAAVEYVERKRFGTL